MAADPRDRPAPEQPAPADSATGDSRGDPAVAEGSQEDPRGPSRPEHRTDHRSEPRRPSLRGIARRLLFDAGDDDAPDAPRHGDIDDDEQRRRLEARAILGALLETGDKAKTETVRLVAREVRGYLEALELGRDLEHLLTNYSLEVKASVHLAPLDDAARSDGPKATAGLKKRVDQPTDDD